MTHSRFAICFGEALDLDLIVGDEAPPTAQALIVPQDVHLILGETGPIEDTAETPEEVLTRSGHERPRRPGSVVEGPSRAGAPLVFQAIVYDFDRSPTCREEHVFEALLAAFEQARQKALLRLAVQPLGTAHAGLEPERFLRLLTQVCYSSAELGTTVRHVHLLLPSPEDFERYERLLQQLMVRRRVER